MKENNKDPKGLLDDVEIILRKKIGEEGVYCSVNACGAEVLIAGLAFLVGRSAEAMGLRVMEVLALLAVQLVPKDLREKEPNETMTNGEMI